ncbi:MAG: methyltransferase domain-containing protein [Acidimicrobiales bacterium]|jgi:hypothetical protein
MTTEDQLLDIAQLARDVGDFQQQLTMVKSGLAPSEEWYPYESLSNALHLDRLLTGDSRSLATLARGLPIADIGAADGDMAFYLASRGLQVDIVDYGPTNWNGLRGARLLQQHFGDAVSIHEVDLDSQFSLPRPHYGLALVLGLLYHLQNPFYVFKHLAMVADNIIFSTRIAATTPDGHLALTDYPLAYLVDPHEMNNDPTNYWVFSRAALLRLLERTGWRVVDEMTVGRTEGDSDPVRADRDERAFVRAVSVSRVGMAT